MRYLAIGAIGGPLLVWGVLIATGKRADAAGTALTQRGLVLPFRFGALIESAAGGIAAAWLIKPLVRN